MKDLESEFSAAVGKFSLTGPILSFTLAVMAIASGEDCFQRFRSGDALEARDA